MKFKIKFINYNYDTDFSECSIYLSKLNLELLKLEQGTFVDLNLFKNLNNNDNLTNDNLNKLINKRNVKLFSLENAKDDFIYLTSILWFNLINNQQIDFDYSIDQFYIEIQSNSLIPKLINECHFALIKCPDYNGSVNYDNLFRSYFKNKRFIKLNDVIAIKTIEYPQIYNEFNFQSTIKQIYIFFKCTNLDQLTEGILDENETRMYLIGNQNSYIPRDLYYLDLNSSFDFFIKYNKLINSNLKMLNNYYNKLKEYSFPSIKEYSLANFILLTGELGSGKQYLINELACEFRMNLIEFNADDFLNDTLTINETKIKTNFQLITVYSPCIVLFKNIDILIKSIEGNELRFIELIKLNLDLELKNLEYPIILIATSSSMNCDQILENSEFNKLFKQQLHIDNLRFDERYEILNFIISKLSNNDQLTNQTNQLNELIDIEFLAKETTGLNLINLINLFKKVLLSNKKLSNDNLIEILKQYKKNLKIKNNLPDIPNVKWSDVGGLIDAKKEIFFTIQLTLKYGKLLNSKLKRSGLLFYGPPGTGKTLLAKAIATEFKLNFLSVKGPEIMNMFIGQSEENIRNIFMKAKSIAPSIIFFDELDSIARKRGKNNSSSGVMDRLVSTLLTELDNLNSEETNNEFKPVFVIGATNRPDLLDSALLRYGRFDKLVYIGLDNSKEQRLSILKAITNKFEFDTDCNLEDIELNCPLNLTGADFYGLCSNAHLNALKRKINYLETCEHKIVDDDKIKVNLEDFKESIRNLRLSINEDELSKYEQLNKKFSSK